MAETTFLDANELVLNMGPQHPSTHGVLRVILNIDGEKIMGTECVLKAALRYRTKVLIASTSEVYGKGNSIPFAEEDDVVLGPTSRSRWAYAASKMVDEFLALACHNQFGLDVVLFRLFNTVGPRQTGQYGMVIPRFVRQALRGKPITVYGDGTQQRCFCHVEEAVKAIVQLADYPKAAGHVFNIGATEEVSIGELALKIKELTDSDSEILKIPYDEVFSQGFEDMTRRVPDISRTQTSIGWSSEKSLVPILESVIEYESSRLGSTS